MPYPNYSLKEKCGHFFEILARFIPMIFWALIAGAALMLGYYNVIPVWLCVISSIACFARMNYFFWSYQAWRSSGPRGIFVNPIGPAHTDLRTAGVWLASGVFLHFYHVWLRSHFYHRLLKKAKEQ